MSNFLEDLMKDPSSISPYFRYDRFGSLLSIPS